MLAMILNSFNVHPMNKPTKRGKMIGFHPWPEVRKAVHKASKEKRLPMGRIVNEVLHAGFQSQVAAKPVMEVDESHDSP